MSEQKTTIDHAAEVEQLRQELLKLHSYARGFVFTEDPAKAQAMPTSQRYAAIAGHLARLERTGVLRSGGVS
jgi:hypothetical protein